MSKYEDYQRKVEHQEQIEHRDVLLAIGVLLKSKEGKQLFNYLFKTIDVITAPEQGLEGNMLHEYLGFLRAGNSIYKLVSEADYEEAALILSKIERKKYDDLIEQHRLNDDTD